MELGSLMMTAWQTCLTSPWDRLPSNTICHPLITVEDLIEYPSTCSTVSKMVVMLCILAKLMKPVGKCRISVEVAGSTTDVTIALTPDDIRSMAAWVIFQCVHNRAGIGGFVTLALEGFLDYILESTKNNGPSSHYRKSFFDALHSPLCHTNLKKFYSFWDPVRHNQRDRTIWSIFCSRRHRSSRSDEHSQRFQR